MTEFRLDSVSQENNREQNKLNKLNSYVHQINHSEDQKYNVLKNKWEHDSCAQLNLTKRSSSGCVHRTELIFLATSIDILAA